jgi:hypothetical protein
MKYGDLPRNLGQFDVQCEEMMFVQYMPIKLIGGALTTYDDRFLVFKEIIDEVCEDFINAFSYEEWCKSYVYLTAKHMYQVPNASFNRHGYHSDGFMTNDINYIWSNKFPTVFNTSKFNLTLDDRISIGEMEEQAKKENEITYADKSLVRLNEYNIHKVGDNSTGGLRTFVKVSFSKDKYDLIGNAHNHLLGYNWEMKERSVERNIPQTLIQKEVIQYEDEWIEINDVIQYKNILHCANKIEPIKTLNTLETFEADYIIDEDYFKITYKIKSNEKPRLELLIHL